jgi:tetratricopeptide (TPR) repeat protein
MPGEIRGYLALTQIYLMQDKKQEAVDTLEDALESGIGSAPVYFYLGLAYNSMKKYDEAIEAYKRALALGADGSAVHFYIGAAYASMGRFNEAVEELEKAVELDPDNAEACNYLGYMYAEKGIKLDEAKDLIEKALARDPKNGAYIDSLGWVYYKQGAYNKALEELKRAAGIISRDPVIREHLGDAYAKKRMWKEALDEWGRVLELDPDNKEVKGKIDRLRGELGMRRDERGQEKEIVVEVNPEPR